MMVGFGDGGGIDVGDDVGDVGVVGDLVTWQWAPGRYWRASERERDGTRCWDKLSPQVRTGDILKSLFSGNWPISWSWSKTRVIIIKLPPVWQDAISCCNLIRWLLGIEVKPSDHFIYLVQSARDPGLTSCCSEHCWEMYEMGHSHRTVKTFCLENDT